LQVYVDVFFPRAVAIARALRDLGGQERLLYTSHSWLLSLYIHCPLNLTLNGKTLRCPTDAAVNELTASIQAGDIYFHAGAFNIEYEQAIIPSVIDFSFQLARNLAGKCFFIIVFLFPSNLMLLFRLLSSFPQMN
jgi:hypothetical protein